MPDDGLLHDVAEWLVAQLTAKDANGTTDHGMNLAMIVSCGLGALCSSSTKQPQHLLFEDWR
eukprot:5434232-Amphidinium_carterae.1